MSEIYQEIPTWDNGTWTETSFDSREEYAQFLLELFKLPGEYKFDKTSHEFNIEGKKFDGEAYGLPILKFEDVLGGTVKSGGLGPLHLKTTFGI